MSARSPARWADVHEGDVLPEVTIPVTLRLCVLDAAATRDFFPGHHDRDYARSQNVRDVYLNTMFFHGFVDRVGGDWAGPDAWLLRRQLWMMAPICVGETIRTEGRVLRRFEKAGRRVVEVEVRVLAERGLGARAVLTYLFPGPDGCPVLPDATNEE